MESAKIKSFIRCVKLEPAQRNLPELAQEIKSKYYMESYYIAFINNINVIQTVVACVSAKLAI